MQEHWDGSTNSKQSLSRREQISIGSDGMVTGYFLALLGSSFFTAHAKQSSLA
jgi:hypothetical protein